MIEYRQDRMIGTLYRRVAGTPEEYDGRTKEWKLTGQALAAYGPSSDTRRISEEDAIEIMERQEELIKTWQY